MNQRVETGLASAPAARAADKIVALESVRGIAAMLVVIHHMPAWYTGFYDIRFIRNCYLLVDLFFVLSGFVIYTAYGDRIRSWGELARFQFLRLGRLYPVHLLYLAVFVGFEFAKYFAQNNYGVTMPNTAPFKESGGTALIEQIFLAQAIGPTGNALTFNGPAWSISVEFYTYLIFGLIVLFAHRIKHVIFFVLTAICVALLFNKTTFGSTDLLRCLAGFFLGCLVAAKGRNVDSRISAVAAAAASAALFIFLSLNTDSRFDSVIDLLTAVLILGLANSERGGLHSVLQWGGFRWLGAISYSIYMSHTAVIWTVNQVFRVVLKRPVLFLGDRMTPQLSALETIAAYAFVVICVLLVSQATFTLVENPLRQKSRKLIAAHG